VVSIILDSLLSTLKPRQLEAIKHPQAPQLILTGAGTGKTTTITANFAYMVKKRKHQSLPDPLAQLLQRSRKEHAGIAFNLHPQ